MDKPCLGNIMVRATRYGKNCLNVQNLQHPLILHLFKLTVIKKATQFWVAKTSDLHIDHVSNFDLFLELGALSSHSFHQRIVEKISLFGLTIAWDYQNRCSMKTSLPSLNPNVDTDTNTKCKAYFFSECLDSFSNCQS